MSILNKIPNEITIFYMFFMLVISLVYSINYVYVLVGLLISIIPIMKKAIYNKKVVILEKVGKGLQLDVVDCSVSKKNEVQTINYGDVSKEKPDSNFWLVLKRGLNNLMQNEAMAVYKDGENYSPINIEVNIDKVKFTSEYVKEQDIREAKRRRDDMKNTRDWGKVLQIFNGFLLIATSVTIIWGVSVILEQVGLIQTELNDLPYEFMNELGRTLVEFSGMAEDLTTTVNDSFTLIQPQTQ